MQAGGIEGRLCCGIINAIDGAESAQGICWPPQSGGADRRRSGIALARLAAIGQQSSQSSGAARETSSTTC